MKFNVPKGYGNILANFIRQLLLTKVETWRPVAFKIDETANVVSAGAEIIEDSVEIINNLNDYLYDIDCDDDVFVFSAIVKNLTTDDLSHGAIHILNATNTATIFQSLHQEVTVKIYFRKAVGSLYQEQNLFFLEQEKNVIESANNVVIFNSRHTNFSTVSALSEEYSDHEDQITLDVNANYEVDVESVVKQVCFNTAALLQKIG